MIAPEFQLRQKHLPRCPRCAMHDALCICALLAPRMTRTRITMLIHIKEWARTSNSGRHLSLVLSNAEVRIRGQKGRPMSSEGLAPDTYRNVVLFPSDDAEVISAAWLNEDERPTHFLVPDGNWGQASRTIKREPALAKLPRVCLPPGPPSRFRLRRHPDVTRVATFEAVARALGITESLELQSHLETVFDVAVERALWSRGELRPVDVTGGIPRAALVSPVNRDAS